MKNIHVLPTDKPSRLIIYSTLLNEFRLLNEPIEDWKHKKHIYITSDEEFDGYNFVINSDGKIESVPNSKWGKKIILTTDQDLIKDGVQDIHDAFLEWFVKNPSCEYVATPIVELCANCREQFCDNRDCRGYIDEPYYLLAYSENITEKTITYCDGYEVFIPKEEPKQETLEEIAEKYAELSYYNRDEVNSFVTGAKWQAERMYSEEDMEKSFEAGRGYHEHLEMQKAKYFEPDEIHKIDYKKYSFDKWFEQFKKK